MSRRRRRSRRVARMYVRWFTVLGVVGLVVAFVMLYMLSHEMVSGNLALILWPTSMLLLADGVESDANLLTTGLAFGGNFLLYGLIGLLFAYLSRRRVLRQAAREAGSETSNAG